MYDNVEFERLRSLPTTCTVKARLKHPASASIITGPAKQVMAKQLDVNL